MTTSTPERWSTVLRGSLVQQLAGGGDARVDVAGVEASIRVVTTSVRRFAWTVRPSDPRVLGISGVAISISAACDAVVRALEERVQDPPSAEQLRSSNTGRFTVP